MHRRRHRRRLLQDPKHSFLVLLVKSLLDFIKATRMKSDVLIRYVSFPTILYVYLIVAVVGFLLLKSTWTSKKTQRERRNQKRKRSIARLYTYGVRHARV